MKLLKFAISTIALTFWAAACNNPNAPTATPNANAPLSEVPASKPPANPVPPEWAAAHKLYTDTCVNCHKADGTGGETSFSEGEPPIKVPSFKSDKLVNEPDAEFIDVIKNGDEAMPAFKKRYNDDQIKLLVAYIRNRFQGKNVTPPAAATTDKPAENNPNTTASAAPADDKGGKMKKEGEHEKGEKEGADDKKK
jgi:mono/diheme cytochrome c family protein